MDTQEGSLLLVTESASQTTLLANYLAEHTGLNTRVVSPEAQQIPDLPPCLALFDLAVVSLQQLQEWQEKAYTQDEGTLMMAAFNLHNEDQAVEVLSFIHLKGLFYWHDSLEQMAQGILSIFAGEMWASRRLTTQVIDNLRRQHVNAFRLSGNLTPRERQIIGLVGLGASNAQIADQLFLSEHTVKSHIYNIFKKTGVKNRTQAVIWARDHLGAPPLNAFRKRTHDPQQKRQ